MPRYRASVPYLAAAPAASLRDPATWRFFTGRDLDGSPKWATRAEWDQTAAGLTRWKPPGGAELFASGPRPGRCIGEFSITWDRPLHTWLMLYNCRGEIEARIAPAPWGPWSASTVILGSADPFTCHLLMSSDGCGTQRDFHPDRHVNGKLVAGSFYAPFVLDRYTTKADLPSAPGATIYWLVSTWNPYEVTVVRTTLQAGGR